MGLFLLLTFSIPPDGRSLTLDVVNHRNHFFMTKIKPADQKQDEVPDWLKSKSSGEEDERGQRHRGEQGKMGSDDKSGLGGLDGPRDKPDPLLAEHLAEDASRTAGVLGLLKRSGGVRSPSIFGRDSALGAAAEISMGGLSGGSVDDAHGVGGLGLIGTGREGEAESEGTVGLGALNKIVNGGDVGDAAGYGRGSGRSDAPRAKAPRVIAGQAYVRGALSKEIVKRIIRRHINEVKYCHQKALPSDPDLNGGTNIQFTIAPTGQVVSSAVMDSTTDNPEVDKCIAQTVRRWLFPKPRGGGLVVVTYPFKFRSSGSPSTEQPPAGTPPSKKRHKEITRSGADKTPAQIFWASRKEIALPHFREPVGYWANTYVPGDPAIRLLQARLADFDRGQLVDTSDRALKLDDASRPYRQTFDPPQHSALSVYLHADHRGVQGQTRALVQVGLQSTSRFGGRRPEMNIAVVLDWRGAATTHVMASVRALLLALAQARDIGDRFTLTVVGKSGSITVPAKNFRHGPLVVALQRPGSDNTSPSTPAQTLRQAIEEASGTFDADDPIAPLSSRLILLVVTGGLKDELPQLSRLAHHNAVSGIPMSVVGVGGGFDDDQLTPLILAGQGNRRTLTSPAQAVDLVDRELSAAASVVARAVRLRIRLAAGVKLVNILGSHPLGQGAAQRVREAEQSIDRRMAKQLGMAADRGQDEEGIQIVIPSFYAGDAHTILLDVVVPGPGPVADVTVRYKDLVYLRNNVARAHFNLARGTDHQGPLERSVLKNLMSYKSSLALKRAGTLLGKGHRMAAIAQLEKWHQLLAELRRETPGLAQDEDIGRDLAMFDEYRTLLGTLGDDPRQGTYLARSLQYAGYLKIVSRRPDK